MSRIAAAKVLIVDPAHYAHPLLRTVLASLGITSISNVRTTEQALSALRAERFDVIFFGETGGDQSGFVKAVRCDGRGRNAFIPVVLVTGGLQQTQITEARIAGMHDVIMKPMSVGTIERKLRALLLVTHEGDDPGPKA
jgi:PleD family two-component response regulator